MRNITDHFAKVLKAPLHNNMWSWGAVGEDGRVYLRCWNDEVIKYEGKTFIVVNRGTNRSLGAPERRRHLALVVAGAPCRAVMCVAKDVRAVPRVIASYQPELWILGNELVTIDGVQHLQALGTESV